MTALSESATVLEIHPVGPMQCNCSIFGCNNSRECIVVDPGGDADLILARIKALNLHVRYVLITHAHFDHVLAARAIKNATGAQVCVHPKDKWLYWIVPLQCRMFGAEGRHKMPPYPDWWLSEGDQIPVGGYHADVIHTPGHTPGSCRFHLAEKKLLWSGDTLFHRAVGNWEYPGGSFAALIDSILTKLWNLPDATRVIPGHGDETTIGDERRLNPYLVPERIKQIRAEEASRPGLFKQMLSLLGRLVGISG